jgi:hypothetical protein
MAKIQPPRWAPDAIPTDRGWVSKSGELLVSRKHRQDELDEYFGVTAAPAVVKTVNEFTGMIESEPVLLTEAPVGNISLESMTKAQLQALANEHGIVFKGFVKKEDMIEQLLEIL